MLEILKDRAATPQERTAMAAIAALYTDRKCHIGDEVCDIGRGVQRGSVTSPALFAVLLDHVCSQFPVLTKAITKQKVVAYADDMIEMCDNKDECVELIQGFKQLEHMGSKCT